MSGTQRKVWERRGVLQTTGLGLTVFLLTGLSFPARAQQGTTAPASPSAAPLNENNTPQAGYGANNKSRDDYVVSPEDLLDIEVLDVPELTHAYRVSSNGLLTMPLLPEPIAAAGQSLNQLSRLIATKFRDAGMLNNAQVTVAVRETRLHTVLVSGEVKTPQAILVYGPTRLLDVLVRAGGLSPDAGDDVIIVRGDAGAHADEAESANSGAENPSAHGQSFTLNIRKLLETGSDTSNILLYPGDRLVAQRAQLIYVMGAVAHPGGYVVGPSRQQFTVLKLLAMAGDVTNLAKRNHITLLRRNPAEPVDSLKREQILVNYKAMVKGKITDMKLIPDDIVFVPESAGMKALHSGVNSAIQVATYSSSTLLIYH